MVFSSARRRVIHDRGSHRGRGDQVKGGGGPDPRELPPKGLRIRDIYTRDLHIDTIKVKTRNFH